MPRPHKLKSGADAHVFTAEERRKGAFASHKTRREQKMTDAEWFRSKIEEDRERFYVAAAEQALQGDWRAWQFMHERGYGKPVTALEISGPDGGPVSVVEVPLDDLEAARLILEQARDPEA